MALSVMITGLACGGGATANAVPGSSPTSFAYQLNPAVYTRGTAITPNKPIGGGESGVAYSISPALPNGLSLDPGNGTIMGTPLKVTAFNDYSVTKRNAAGSTSTAVGITVNDVPPSNLIYSEDSAVYTVGTGVTPNVPVVGGGAVVSFDVVPKLPLGLTLDSTTGVVSGIPLMVTSKTVHSVTANNSGGHCSVDILITVNDAPPLELTYSQNPATYAVETAIAPNRPTNKGGDVVSYSAAPALPAGLGLNLVTGVISGTPTFAVPRADFTITASNSGGTCFANVSIAVDDAPPRNLTYAINPATYTAGLGIVPNRPTSQGGPVSSYSVTPALPAGISLDATTGVISGTPSAVTPSAVHEVSAVNASGSAQVALVINVMPATLVITTQPSPQIAQAGQSVTFRVEAAGTGDLRYQWLKDGTALPGANGVSYTTPAVVPADSGSAFAVRVEDSFGGSVISREAVLTVLGPETLIAGCESNGARWVAKTWLNGIPSSLSDGSNHAVAYAIARFGNDIYAAGYEDSSGIGVAKVWKNGIASALTDGRNSAVALCLALSEGSAVIAGYEGKGGTGVATIWANGTSTALTDGSNSSAVNSVAVSGADLFAAGFENNGTKDVAKVWKNGVATSLTDGALHARAQSIAVSGSDVYVVGYSATVTNDTAMLWQNGVAIPLTDGSAYARANAVALRGTDVYVAGFVTQGIRAVATVWKNGIPIYLTDGTVDSFAYSITSTGTDVLVTGSIIDGHQVAVVWKNNVMIRLTQGSSSSVGFSVVANSD